jgi:hypothetical protein
VPIKREQQLVYCPREEEAKSGNWSLNEYGTSDWVVPHWSGSFSS